jgi:hypothetical protein
MKMKAVLAGAALAFALAGPAKASLILLGPQDFGGTGLGAVNTILTIQATGQSTTESGGVSWNGSADIITGGDVKTGSSQTQTRTLGQLGVTNAAELRMVFNAVEPRGGGQESISLDNLVLNIYSPSGDLLFNSGTFTPILFSDVFAGTGNSGFVFGLDADQQAQATAQGAFSSMMNRVGIFASASLADGGPETFFVASVPSTPTPVPLPGAMAMLAVGLAGMMVVRRRNGAA